MKARKYVAAMLAAALAGAALSDGALSDAEEKEKILNFVMLPSRLCGRATIDFRRELSERKLTNRAWFDGDTNRLARLICELAQTNNANVASMMMDSLGEYGTPAQLPFLYSCATNPAVANSAVKAVLRIEGVTSNSVAAAVRYFLLTNVVDSADRSRTSICVDLIRLSKVDGVDPVCRSNALAVAHDFAFGPSCNYYWLDSLLIEGDPTYRFSKRRIGFMRGIATYAAQWQFMANYVTNAINELVAYPEANLPD